MALDTEKAFDCLLTYRFYYKLWISDHVSCAPSTLLTYLWLYNIVFKLTCVTHQGYPLFPILFTLSL